MSNTLKFGNGKWATKKGSTLAYNDENGNFKMLYSSEEIEESLKIGCHVGWRIFLLPISFVFVSPCLLRTYFPWPYNFLIMLTHLW